MAVATAHCTCPRCGLEFKWSVTKYNRREADNFEQLYDGTERLCKDCYKKVEAEESAKALKELCKKYEIELPELEGTEKQVDWATTIRLEKFKILEETNFKFKEVFSLPIFAAVKKAVCSPSANFWIEHRDDDARTLMAYIRKIAAESQKKEEK